MSGRQQRIGSKFDDSFSQFERIFLQFFGKKNQPEENMARAKVFREKKIKKKLTDISDSKSKTNESSNCY